ncbi:MAG: hypothetical protein GX580_13920 [Candidatus Hydrogenedens sp.]|nr:hypothetical protein [Candidatus Hydrogenedens sp.]
MICVICPQCGKQLAIPEQYAGQRGRCNGCGGEITVPVIQAGPPPLNPADGQSSNPIAYAGFWRRVLAYMIDMCVLSIPNLMGSFFVAFPLMNYLNEIITVRILVEYQLLVYSAAQGGISFVLFFLIAWPYFAVMESSRLQATLGKMVLGIRVTTTSGGRISVFRSIWRYFMKLFSGLLLSTGYFMAAFTARKQALHDKAARTLVIVSTPKPASWARLTVLGMSAALLVVSSVAGVLAANMVETIGGDGNAELALGVRYAQGSGVARDYNRAIALYRKSAKLGNAGAQFNLGNCYYLGQGVPKDAAQAVEWFRKAAEKGLADAQHNLGVCYSNGEGVPKDLVQAAAWWQKAAEQGNANAQFLVGGCYAGGEGVQQNLAYGAEWYRRAAEQGHADAQGALGGCYYNGEGVSEDAVKAYMWFDLAAAERPDAASIRDEIAVELTPEQVAAATRLAAEFRARSSKAPSPPWASASTPVSVSAEQSITNLAAARDVYSHRVENLQPQSPVEHGPASAYGTPMPITEENVMALAHVLERESKRFKKETEELIINNAATLSEEQRMAIAYQTMGNFFQRGFVDPISEAGYDPGATLYKFSEVAYAQFSGNGVPIELATGPLAVVWTFIPMRDALYSQGLISAENLYALNQIQNLIGGPGAQ